MKKQVSLLVELQKNDSEMKEIEQRKEVLPHELERLRKELTVFEEKLNDGKIQLDDLIMKHSDREKKLKQGVENIKKIKSRLFDVKTNKEYQALLTEMDIINGKNDEIESEILHVLEAIDAVKEEVEKEEKEFAVFRANHVNEIETVEKELGSVDALLGDIREKNEEVRKRINAELLKKYEIIKERRNGRAVVPVWKETCGGCHMNIPPQMYNELQRLEDLMQCPHCNRIIYWDDRSNEEQ